MGSEVIFVESKDVSTFAKLAYGSGWILPVEGNGGNNVGVKKTFSSFAQLAYGSGWGLRVDRRSGRC